MARWFSKRWVWAALTGATLAVGFAAARPDGDGPPKVGTVVPLNVDGKGERQFKVVKSEKQPDGSYLSELKDVKTGETITLYDKPADAQPTPPGPAKKAEPTKKAKPSEMPPPPASNKSAPADPPKEEKKEKRPLLSRIFGDRDKDKASPMPGTPTPAASSAMKIEAPADSGKKPGVLSRIFGSKKPSGPSMPATAASLPSGSGGGSQSAPPPIIPTPPGGVKNPAPPAAKPAFPSANPSLEPPRVMPSTRPAPGTPPPQAKAPAKVPVAQPVSAPAFPVTSASPSSPPPAPLPIPTPAPVSTPAPLPVSTPKPAPSEPPVTTPTPVPAPSVPGIPSVPALPASTPAPLPVPPPPGAELPPIPVPMGASSARRVSQTVIPAGYVAAHAASEREVQPFVTALQTMSAPSARLTAAKALADCRHSSTDGVKAVLFQAARLDPCSEVRAACITHLCDLGYFEAQFLAHIRAACDDADPMVRDAAKAACAKMIRK